MRPSHEAKADAEVETDRLCLTLPEGHALHLIGPDGTRIKLFGRRRSNRHNHLVVDLPSGWRLVRDDGSGQTDPEPDRPAPMPRREAAERISDAIFALNNAFVQTSEDRQRIAHVRKDLAAIAEGLVPPPSEGRAS